MVPTGQPHSVAPLPNALLLAPPGFGRTVDHIAWPQFSAATQRFAEPGLPEREKRVLRQHLLESFQFGEWPKKMLQPGSDDGASLVWLDTVQTDLKLGQSIPRRVLNDLFLPPLIQGGLHARQDHEQIGRAVEQSF